VGLEVKVLVTTIHGDGRKDFENSLEPPGHEVKEVSSVRRMAKGRGGGKSRTQNGARRWLGEKTYFFLHNFQLRKREVKGRKKTV